jgi:Ribosomal protein L10
MREEKQLLLDEIKDKIDQSTALVLTKYQKLDPNLAATFRESMSKAGGHFEVVKKRILVKAAAASGVVLDVNLLQGHIGVIFALEDPITVTKEVFQFAKDNEEVFEVLGGRFEGKLCSPQDVEQISKLPSKDEMRAQFLSVLEAPMAQTLSTMEALLTSVMHCLENKTQQQNS